MTRNITPREMMPKMKRNRKTEKKFEIANWRKEQRNQKVANPVGKKPLGLGKGNVGLKWGHHKCDHPQNPGPGKEARKDQVLI